MGLFVIGVVGLGYLTFSGVKGFVVDAPWGDSAGPSFQNSAATQTVGGIVGTPEAWSGGKINILLMGIDQRRYEEGPWRTDTMILITIDPITKRAALLSIPRDLWVEIPDYSAYDRINTAHFRGDADQYPGGGGPALAMKTVQANFGVPVNYFVRVNFYAFISLINQIGCVPIHVDQAIDDPTYPASEGSGYDPFHIEAGDYCMDGETLLKYARTRATFGSDFDRAARQQQVIEAVREHILSTGQLPNLITQAPALYTTVADGVATNLTLQQIAELALLGSEIPRDKICSMVITGEYIQSLETLADNSQVLIPDTGKVRQLALDAYNGTGKCTPGGEDLAALAAPEKARISILNGTTQEGLATETGNMLAALGLNVVSLGNAERFDYPNTLIYNFTEKTNTARYIAHLLNVPETAITAATDPSGTMDIQVIIGADYFK
jgi:LCP family protein required for cell wall assembly